MEYYSNMHIACWLEQISRVKCDDRGLELFLEFRLYLPLSFEIFFWACFKAF